MLSRLSFFLLLFFCFPSFHYAEIGNRAYWIERYLSVSYPLESVKFTSLYGTRKDPFTGKPSHHGGLDLRARFEGVYAMFDGTVVKTGSDARSGLYIILRHGEYTISYCHLSKIQVTKGASVLAGDIVAVSGNSGRSTAPHLHITCRYRGEVTDPSTLFLYIESVRKEALTALGGLSYLESFDSETFLAMYSSLAMSHQQRYGIPASVTLAQMAYESGWGRSTLALEGNNYFGIKCSREWLASGKPYSLHDDDKKGEKFCNYSSVEESMEHHSELLMSDRYKVCRSCSPTDYHGWLQGLKSCGYATDKDYVSLCEKIISRYRLYEYDSHAIGL